MHQQLAVLLLLSKVAGGARLSDAALPGITTRAFLALHHFGREAIRVSALPPGRGREVAVVPYQQTSSNRGAVLRAAAEDHRRTHVPDLMGRCRIDGQAHPCYQYAAAGLVLSTVSESEVHPTGGVRTAVLLIGSVVLAIGILAALWLWWVR